MANSIKIKIYTFLTFLILLPISYIIYSSITLESKDKVNNAQQNQLTELKYANEKFSGLFNSVFNTLRNIAAIRPDQKTEKEYSIEVSNILNNQKEISQVIISEIPLLENSKPIVKYSTLNFEKFDLIAIVSHNNHFLINKKPFFLDTIEYDNKKFLLINLIDYNYDEKFHSKLLMHTALINLSTFDKDFNYLVQLVSKVGKLLYSSDNNNISFENHPLLKNVNSKHKVTFEYVYENKKFLGSSASPIDGVFLLVSQPMDNILEYLYQLIQKIIIIGLISLFSSLLIMKIFISKYLMKPIETLVIATGEVSKGNFNIAIPVKSKDEMGQLSNSFNIMSKEIDKLLKNQEQSIKMENEVNISATVQQNLLPPKTIETNFFSIKSFYHSSSKCGGDLWTYFVYNNKMYIMIADATGHGLTSAMITFTAKSVFSIVENMVKNNHLLTPSQILQMQNKAIFDASSGQINMTMFVAIINLEDHSCIYSNAGHNPPWILGNKFQSLCSENSRLGVKPVIDDEIVEKTVKINKDDYLFLYTDGIIEGTKKDEIYGKKRVKQVLENNLNKKEPLYYLVKDFLNFTKKPYFEDDVTLVILKLHMNQEQNNEKKAS